MFSVSQRNSKYKFEEKNGLVVEFITMKFDFKAKSRAKNDNV
jgi:hypothetical protein